MGVFILECMPAKWRSSKNPFLSERVHFQAAAQLAGGHNGLIQDQCW